MNDPKKFRYNKELIEGENEQKFLDDYEMTPEGSSLIYFYYIIYIKKYIFLLIFKKRGLFVWKNAC